MKCSTLAAAALAIGLATLPLIAADPTPDEVAPRYQLEYKFSVGEEVRWEVIHRATVTSNIEGSEQTAKTRSESVKVWKIDSVGETGDISFTHLVESVKMTNQLPQRAVVEYDSQKHAVPPPGFGDVAKAIGVPLTEVHIDNSGKVLSREQKLAQPGNTDEASIAIPLPPEPVPVGHVWAEPHEVQVTLPGSKTRKIKTRRRFELRGVEGDIATISSEYQMLTPVQDPAIEAQLIQRLHKGEIRFDMAAGRIVGQQLDVDRRTIGFSGATSSMHYLMRFTERLLAPDERVAVKPIRPAGPELPSVLKRQ